MGVIQFPVIELFTGIQYFSCFYFFKDFGHFWLRKVLVMTNSSMPGSKIWYSDIREHGSKSLNECFCVNFITGYNYYKFRFKIYFWIFLVKFGCVTWNKRQIQLKQRFYYTSSSSTRAQASKYLIVK